MKPIFHKGLPLLARIALFVVMGLAILLIDTRSKWLDPVRQGFMTLSIPLYQITDMPTTLLDWGRKRLVSRESLQEENLALKAQNRVLQQKLQKMATLIVENTRLTELLNSSHTIEDDVLIARLIGISPDPTRQGLVLDKGLEDGAFVNQAVLDAHGVAGLVTEAAKGISRVMLITDTHSAVPVQVVRNGIRFIVEGTGHPRLLRLRYVASTADIQEGDVLVSSGLDAHFPANYPVATIVSIEHHPGAAFLTVMAEPVAQLDQSRHFLLVLNQDKTSNRAE
jgi:rod shape-determining protein MreC